MDRDELLEYADVVKESIDLANELIDRLELYRWLNNAEQQELFDVLVDGYIHQQTTDRKVPYND